MHTPVPEPSPRRPVAAPAGPGTAGRDARFGASSRRDDVGPAAAQVR